MDGEEESRRVRKKDEEGTGGSDGREGRSDKHIRKKLDDEKNLGREEILMMEEKVMRKERENLELLRKRMINLEKPIVFPG